MLPSVEDACLCFFKINRLLDKRFLIIDCDLLVSEGCMPKYIDVISLVNNGTPKSSVILAITRATTKAKEALRCCW